VPLLGWPDGAGDVEGLKFSQEKWFESGPGMRSEGSHPDLEGRRRVREIASAEELADTPRCSE